jgi:hypothetical protein
MINRYDDFTRLREMVLGKVNYSPLALIKDEKDRDFIRHVLDETSVVLDRMEAILKKFDVTVWRPETFEHSHEMKLGAPYSKIDTVYTSLTPYDNFFTIADTIVEMSPASGPSAVFDHVQYQHVWKEKFAQGSRWISMPRPSYHVDKANNTESLSNYEPYADSPSLLPIGDVIYVAENWTVNQLGMDWLKREFPQFKFKVLKHTNGHLDSYFSVVKPGLAISGIAKNKLPDEFKNWTILEFGKEDYTDVSVVSNIFQDDDHENTTLAVNAFSIDENNIIMSKHTVDTCPKQIKVIEDCGINIIPLEFDVSRWLNQGIHCLSNPLVRDGGLINYF